ncbi:unnamed protein product [Notodromas monacha]|uniref:ER membrane protein complex subunit 1 n=1 Tax=Notodromas monacha TaxID=399045 RepID=A0A7R9BHX0_9CRUS|nr:unnamed protein product [Notodromas monacha]CAG0915798.1 unnamed protein product [Notodromas monacha]
MAEIFRALCLWLGVCLCAGYGMYEDQIGKFDWHQEYLGKTKLAVFERSAVGGGRRIFVATEKNVLAALNPKNGVVQWRKVFEGNDPGEVKFLGLGENVITVTADGLARGWDPISGALHWQIDVSVNNEKKCDWITYALDEVDNIFVFCGNVGEKSINAQVFKSEPSANSASIAEHFLPCQWLRSNTRCTAVGHVLACLNPEEETIAMLDLRGILSSNPVEFSFHSLTSGKLGDSVKTILGRSPTVSALRGLEMQPYLVIESNVGYYAVLEISLNSEPKLVSSGTVPDTLIAGSIADDKPYLIILESNMKVTILDLLTGTSHKELLNIGNLKAERGNVESMHVQLFVKKESGTISSRMMLTMQDFSSLMVQVPGKMLWTREEALASVVGVEMVDLPMSLREVSVEKEFMISGGPFSMFIQRITSQFSQIHQVGMTLLGIMEQEIGLRPDEKPILERDEFNLKKLIVLATQPGKLFGLESGNGKIVWATFLPNLAPLSREQSSIPGIDDLPKFTKEKILLFLQRTSSHYPHLPLMTAVGQKKDSEGGYIVAFNPISGTLLESHPTGLELDFRPVVASVIHKTDENSLHPILILGDDGKVKCFPESSVSSVYEFRNKIFLYTIDQGKGLIRGYGLQPSSNTVLETEQLWQLNLPVNDQVLTVTKPKDIWEKVHSPGRVMGDRSVLYKYINPNLFAVVGEGYDPNNKYFINVYLVDGVTGQIVTSANHKRARGPVYVEHSENWLVYSYFNEKLKRMEVATMSFYEGNVERDVPEISSLHPPANSIMVEKQAYIFPAGFINAMRATVTEKGITSRHILFSIPSGHIVEMPWAWLDPMRPMHMAQMTRVEDLPPYVPELALPMEARINYNITLSRVDDIYTAASGLESTCLMLAYGLDLFSSRVTPSKTFDLLKDDFDHVFIAVVLVGLLGASYITKYWASRKTLAQAWK